VTYNLKEILKDRKFNKERLEKEAPNLYNGFSELMKYYYKPGGLDRKQKELLGVACSVTTQCAP
jgi:alkylhydroperoxidase/carboxymuconolactone decarboxylase family protein YurZ